MVSGLRKHPSAHSTLLHTNNSVSPKTGEGLASPCLTYLSISEGAARPQPSPLPPDVSRAVHFTTPYSSDPVF